MGTQTDGQHSFGQREDICVNPNQAREETWNSDSIFKAHEGLKQAFFHEKRDHLDRTVFITG